MTPTSDRALTRFRAAASLLVAAALVVQTVTPALAQQSGPAGALDEATGRKHFEKGQELYNKNRFLEAAAEFEAGYRALPRSAFLLNVGHSYRRAYELRKAKAAYELMLRVDPTTPHRSLVEDLIRTIDDALIAQETTRAPPASMSPTPLASNSPGPGPTPSSPPLDLGPPAIATTGEPALPESRSLFRSPWFWGAVGTVVVTGVVTTILLTRSGPGCRAQDCFSAP